MAEQSWRHCHMHRRPYRKARVIVACIHYYYIPTGILYIIEQESIYTHQPHSIKWSKECSISRRTCQGPKHIPDTYTGWRLKPITPKCPTQPNQAQPHHMAHERYGTNQSRQTETNHPHAQQPMSHCTHQV